MVAEALLREENLREIAAAIAADVANFLMPGGTTVTVLCRILANAGAQALTGLLRRAPGEAARRGCLDGLAGTPSDRAREICEAVAREHGLPADRATTFVDYAAAIPMTVRAAISRPSDGGAPQTLLSQLPRSHLEALRFMPLRPPHFRPGDQLAGHDYRLRELIGQGGFAEVWKAEHTMQRSLPAVAIKFCFDAELIVGLETEMRIYDRLRLDRSAEHIVRLLGTGYSATPPFLVYEYIDGGDLAAWLADFAGERPSPRDVARIVKMAARALVEPHAAGIVHRDLKPSNLLITRQGLVKLTDFGIGSIRAQSAGAGPDEETEASRLRGAHSLYYSDYRQRRGEAPDPSFDIYSLGVIGYQLLIGDLHREMGPAWQAELGDIGTPRTLIDLLAACVAVPGARLANAGALLLALDRFDLTPSGRTPSAAAAKPAKPLFCTRCGCLARPADAFCIRCGSPIV